MTNGVDGVIISGPNGGDLSLETTSLDHGDVIRCKIEPEVNSFSFWFKDCYSQLHCAISMIRIWICFIKISPKCTVEAPEAPQTPFMHPGPRVGWVRYWANPTPRTFPPRGPSLCQISTRSIKLFGFL